MEIFILAVLVIINGFFALSEIALVSAKKSRLEQKMQEGSIGAATALKLQNDSENFLSAIQVGITLIGIVTGVYGGMNIADDVTPFFEKISSLKPYAHEIALSLTVLIITYISIVIGELVPKTIALSNPEKIAVKVAPVIFYFSKAFYPFVKLLSLSTNFVNSIIGINKQPDQMTEAELRQMIKIASNEGVIEKEQNIIHEKVFYFADKKAKHIMTHRTDVEWIDIDKTAGELREEILECRHSKIVCCRGSLDNFVGILVLNNFFRQMSAGNEINIGELISEPSIVPESSGTQEVLALMRKNKTHICCVVDEFGGFEGLITLNDVIEHIVGYIPEEGEIYEPDVFVRDDNSALVSGDASVEVLSEIIKGFTVDYEEIDYSTVGGFIFNLMGKIPGLGETIDYKGYRIEIIDLDGNRIDKVLITPKKEERK